MKRYIPLVICMWGFVSCSQEPTKEEAAQPVSPPIAVRTKKSFIKDVPSYIETTGKLSPSCSLNICSQVPGILTKLHVKEGQTVKPGEPLFTLQKKPFALKVQELAAELATSKLQLEAAVKTLARKRSLFEKELISQADYEKYQLDLAIANQMLRASDARLKQALLDFEHSTIRSPCKAKVGKLDVFVGELINSETPLTTLVQLDPLIVEFFLTEEEFYKMQNFSPDFEITTLSKNPLKGVGTATFIDHTFDESGRVLVRGKISNPQQHFLSGQAVHVRLSSKRSTQEIVVPKKAIRYNQEGPYLYVVQDSGLAQIKPVHIHEALEDELIALEGIEPDDEVITEGHVRLSPGVKVIPLLDDAEKDANQ